MTLPWRNCYASVALANELNAAYPNRDKSSDGTIGDASHQSRTSDHNLTVKVGDLWVVRARDVDEDGIPALEITEYLRTLGAARDPRLYPNGYVIYEERITSPDFSRWNAYYGSNPHDHHFHVSFTTVQSGFDDARGWGISSKGESVKTAQSVLPASKDDPLTDIEIVTFNNDTQFRGALMAEAGPISTVVDRAWVTAGVLWGGSAEIIVTALNNAGDVTFRKTYQVANNRRIDPVPEIPANSVMVTVEGSKSPGAWISAAVVSKTK